MVLSLGNSSHCFPSWFPVEPQCSWLSEKRQKCETNTSVSLCDKQHTSIAIHNSTVYTSSVVIIRANVNLSKQPELKKISTWI